MPIETPSPEAQSPASRRLVLVAGDAAAGERWVAGQLGRFGYPGVACAAADLLWVANRCAVATVEPVPVAQVSQRLGSECALLVYNAHQGLNPDALAAAVGTLRGGGDCVVLVPELEAWPGFDDPDRVRFAAYPRATTEMGDAFVARLVRMWRGPAVVVTLDGPGPVQLRIAPPLPGGGPHLTAEQARLATFIDSVAHGHAKRPLVLTADRGRGKSTLLGVCAARLLLKGMPRIGVIAPGRAGAEALFLAAQATAGLPLDGVCERLAIGDGELCFRTPGDWSDVDAAGSSLVIVDEAAGIPLAWLERLLARCHRVVFASTVHGYEGSGRGFLLRFNAILDRVMPQWRAASIDAPVRWLPEDPLEVLLNRSLLLDVELAEPGDLGQPGVARLGAGVLVENEPLLRAVFGLLVNAHYQTRPSDLRQLLDNPDVCLWVARSHGVVVGVLLAVVEGNFDTPMAGQVIAGTRRPRGHLLAQSLAVHAGLDACLTLRLLRVQRIAVHPAARRNGIANRLLDTAADWATENGFDLLGCAYGIDAELLAFWRQAGFLPARLGLRVDPASAAHSLMMLRGVSAPGDDLAGTAARRFLSDLPWSLGGPLSGFDSSLACLLLVGRDTSDVMLDTDELAAVQRIVDGARQHETAVSAVWKAVVVAAARGVVDGAAVQPVIARILQHRELSAVCRRFALAGGRAFVARLREVLAAVVSTHAGSG